MTLSAASYTRARPGPQSPWKRVGGEDASSLVVLKRARASGDQDRFAIGTLVDGTGGLQNPDSFMGSGYSNSFRSLLDRV